MGIVSTACPLTLGTGKCRTVCTASIPTAESPTGRCASGANIAATSVSTTCPVLSTM